MRTSALFRVKTSDLSTFKVCTLGQGGRRLCQCGQGVWVSLSRFCADVFYGQSLIL